MLPPSTASVSSKISPGRNACDATASGLSVTGGFIELLVSACSDRWLLRLRSLMFYQLERYRFLSKMNREKSPAQKRAEHRAIMNATLARDAKATALLEQHIRDTSESIYGTLS